MQRIATKTPSRFVVIEVARGKRKTGSKKIFKTRPEHNCIVTSEAARKAEVIAHAGEALDRQASAMRCLGGLKAGGSMES